MKKFDKTILAFIFSYSIIAASFTALAFYGFPKKNVVYIQEQPSEKVVIVEAEDFPNIIEELEKISLVEEYDAMQELHLAVEEEVQYLAAKFGL